MSSNQSETDAPPGDADAPAMKIIERTADSPSYRPPEADIPDLIDLYSGSLDTWDQPWEGDIADPPPAWMGIEVHIETHWWGFELFCNDAAVQVIEFIRRTIFRVIRKALPPKLSMLVALHLRVRAIRIRLISRGGCGVRFRSPWTAPLMLTPRRWPCVGQPEPPVDDQDMRWTVFDPRAMSSSLAWSEPQQFPAHRSAAAPALAEYQGKLYCVYRGPDSDTSLYWTTYESDEPGKGWSDPLQLPLSSHRSGTGPALAEFNGELHCFYMQDSGPGQRRLTGARFAGGRWHPPHFVFTDLIISTQSSPSLVVFNNSLFCYFEHNHQLRFFRFDPSGWTSNIALPVWDAASSPAAAVLQDRMVVVWASLNGRNIFASAYDGNSWRPGERFHQHFTTVKPAVTAFDHQVYCVHRGASDQRFQWSTINLHSWPPVPRPSAPALFPPEHEGSVEPGLVAYQDYNMHGYRDTQLMAVYRGIFR